MTIAILVHTVVRPLIHRSLVKEHVLEYHLTWPDVIASVRSGRVQVVLFDPFIDGESSAAEASEYIQQFSHIPFVACVDVSKPGLLAVARLTRSGLRDILVEDHRGYDEHELRSKLSCAIGNRISAGAIRAFEHSLRHLAPSVRVVVEDLFSHPRNYSTTGQLAAAGKVSPTHLYRLITHAGLGHPRKLVIAARLFAFVGLFGERTLAIKAIANRLGYNNWRVFAQHCKQVFGMRPALAREFFSQESAVGCIIDWMELSNSKEYADRFIQICCQ